MAGALGRLPEYLRVMVLKVIVVTIEQLFSKVHRVSDAKMNRSFRLELWRETNPAIELEGDQAFVEGAIKVGAQEKTVRHVMGLIDLTIAPWLDVGRDEKMEMG